MLVPLIRLNLALLVHDVGEKEGCQLLVWVFAFLGLQQRTVTDVMYQLVLVTLFCCLGLKHNGDVAS